jgi:hypothetical protein
MCWSQFDRVDSKVVGGEVHSAVESSWYFGVIGMHAMSGRDDYFRYRLDLEGLPRLDGRAWVVQRVKLPNPPGQGPERMVADGSTRVWLARRYDVRADDFIYRRYDVATGRHLGAAVRAPVSNGEKIARRFHALTPSGRTLVIYDRGRVRAVDMTSGRAVDAPRLDALVAGFVRGIKGHSYLQPLFTENLEYLVVVSEQLTDRQEPGGYGSFSVGGDEFSFKHHVYACDRASLTARALPRHVDGLPFRAADSVGGSLLILYGSGDRLLLAWPDGRVAEARLPPSLAPIPMPAPYGEKDKSCVLDVAHARVVVLNSSIGTVGVWEYDAGRFTEITGPTDRRIKDAARRS